MVTKISDWVKCYNRHRSKNIWVTRLFFCQNGVLLGESFWQKDSLVTFILFELYLRDRPRFFGQVGHQTTNASIGNKHIFSLNNYIVRLTKIMNNLVKVLKILIFKVIFQCWKSVESFWLFLKNIKLGAQLLLMKLFENLDFWNPLFYENESNFSQLCL